MDKRHFERVRTDAETRVTHLGQNIPGAIHDLSVNGMFFLTSSEIPLQEMIEVEIALPPSAPEPSVKVRGKVVRVEDRGIGVHFAMELGAYRLLKDMVAKIMEEESGVGS